MRSFPPALPLALAFLLSAPVTLHAQQAPPATLPAPWQHADVGRTKVAGNASFADNTFTLQGSGFGIFGPQDSCHILYQSLQGDGQIIAHVETKSSKIPAVAGLTFRASLNPDSRHFSIIVNSAGDACAQSRPGLNYGPREVEPAQARYWLRLTRKGNTFAAYRSVNGRFWEPAGAPLDLAVDPNLFIGMVVHANANQLLASAAFDHVALIPGTPDLTYFADSPYPPAGIVLCDGSVLAGQTTHASDTQIDFTPVDAPSLSLPRQTVGALIFHTAPLSFAKHLAEKNFHQALLVDGQEIEGTVNTLVGETLSLNSVIFGPLQENAKHDVIAAALNTVSSSANRYRITTTNGSVYMVATVTRTTETISFEHPLLGKRTLPLSQIREVSPPTAPR